MTTQTKKFTISFFRKTAKAPARRTFFELAKKNIIRKKNVSKKLSQKVDKITYGV